MDFMLSCEAREEALIRTKLGLSGPREKDPTHFFALSRHILARDEQENVI
jgi:hypothetical protein